MFNVNEVILNIHTNSMLMRSNTKHTPGFAATTSARFSPEKNM